MPLWYEKRKQSDRARRRRNRQNAPAYETGGTGSRTAEAARQRAAGVHAPQMNRMPQAEGLQPGDAGYWEQGQRTHLWRDEQGGFDSILSSLETGQGAGDAIQQLLQNFQGSREELADFLEVAGPMMGALEAKRLEKRMGGMSAIGAYGEAAGQIGQGTRNAARGAQQNLAASGLGRGSASGAIGALLRQQGAGQQADLQSRAIQNNQQMLFDAHRTIAQMALGQGVTPRINSPQGGGVGTGDAVGAGAIQGAAAGAPLGPWGALIGGAAGAGLGYYSSQK
jgi:hypothetical protein